MLSGQDEVLRRRARWQWHTFEGRPEAAALDEIWTRGEVSFAPEFDLNA